MTARIPGAPLCRSSRHAVSASWHFSKSSTVTFDIPLHQEWGCRCFQLLCGRFRTPDKDIVPPQSPTEPSSISHYSDGDRKIHSPQTHIFSRRPTCRKVHEFSRKFPIVLVLS